MREHPTVGEGVSYEKKCMTQKSDQPDKVRIITLTSRVPARIKESEWPIIASSRDAEDEGDERSRWWLTVRRHADGRHIVYARLEVQKRVGPPETLAGGVILENGSGVDVAGFVREVGEECHCSASMVTRCIAGLPAEDL